MTAESTDNGNDIPEQFDRYPVVDIIGQGGMGRVYLAEDPVLERKVAIKVIMFNPSAHQTVWDEYLQRFMVEAKASAKLNHSSIVSVYDAGEENGLPWIAFEYVEGESLENLLSREERLDLVQAVSIAYSIAGALEHAHVYNIIHRDVKPANILLSEEGIAKLADFGIAKAPWSGITREGMTLGSPGYMSPEQIKGLDLDGRSDLFSLGAILYEMLSGEHPFKRDSLDTTVVATISGEHKPLKDLVDDIPPVLDQLVTQCLVADRNQRMSSATEFIDIIHDLDLPGLRTPSSPRLRIFKKEDTDERNDVKDSGQPDEPAAQKVGTKPYPEERKKTGLFIGVGIFIMVVILAVTGFYLKRDLFLSDKTHQGTKIRQQLPKKELLTLQKRATEGTMEAAMEASQKLNEAGYEWPHERFMAEAKKCLNNNDLVGATKIANFFHSLDPASPHKLMIQGRLALRQEQYPEAIKHYTNIFALPEGEALLKTELNEILMDLSPKLEIDEAQPVLIDLVALHLKAADHSQVRNWLKSTNYWLRWNAVSIRTKGKHPINMVDIYILDLEFGDQWQIRKKAALKLGELKDRRAVPALKKAKQKGLKDPLVANAARSVLKKVFNTE